MQETEITVQVFTDLATIIQQLKAKGFQLVGECVLHDWYFTHLADAGQVDYPTLLGNSFLVREVTGPETEVKLCYKDKTLDAAGNVISEQKTTVRLGNRDDALKIFHQAKLNGWCELKQEMHVFQKDQVEFAVQVVDGLGIFIEYEEDATMANLTPAQKMATMHEQLKQLGLPLGNDLSCKKVFMLYQKGQKS